MKSRIISLEDLSDNQKEQVEEQLVIAGIDGVTIGAFIGRTPSELRPLVLNDGNLWLLRTGRLNPARRSFFNSLYGGVASKKDFLRAGEGAGGVNFVLRRYFEQTLADEAEQGGLELSERSVRSLLERLSVLHHRGLFHGHITFGNIARTEEEIHLLDYGWLSGHANYGRLPEDAAPEVIAGQPPGEKSDIFGAGRVLQFCYPQDPQLSSFFQRMVSENPGVRPGISEVMMQLFPGSGHNKHHIISPGRASQQSGVRSGRLIRPTLEKEDDSLLKREPPVLPPAVSSKASVSERPVTADVSNGAAYEAPVSSSGSRNSRIIGYLLASILLVAVGYKFMPFGIGASSTGYDLAYYEAYWSSGQPSLMREVAVAAAGSDRNAELAILRDALSGGAREGVRMHLIRSAFNPDWESELSRRDRELVFKLSLASLLPQGMQRTPRLSSAHPGVVMSVAGVSVLEGGWSELAGVPLSSMVRLKSPYGAAFEGLSRIGVQNMEDLRARALSRILLGDLAVKTIEIFFSGDDSSQAQTEKTRILIYLATRMPEIVEPLAQYLQGAPGVLGERYRWFSADGIVVDWGAIKELEKLFMVAELVPGEPFDFEYYVDLLKYPSADIRHHAEEELIGRHVSADLEQIVRLLSSEFNLLSRYQTVSLIFGLKLPEERAHPFLSAWFDTSPHTQTVLNLLALRSDSNAFKIFGLEAARYLKDRDWEASVGQLRSMSESKEPLVRALAYSRLNPLNQNHLAILRRSLERETVERLREDVENRIKRGGGVAEP